MSAGDADGRSPYERHAVELEDLWGRRALAGALLVFLICALSPASFASSDPYLSLLLSQSLLEQRSFRLDRYQTVVDPPLASYGCDGMIQCHEGHYYYYLPPGPSLFMLPFVMVANGLGYDMGDRADNFGLQRLLSAGLAAAIFLVLFQIAAAYLSPRASLTASLVTVLGSTLVSTVGTAVWNVGFSALFISLSLWLVVRQAQRPAADLHPHWLGFCLFAAYISRPTAAIFIGLIFIYLLWRRPARPSHALLRTAVTAGGLLLLFLAHSWQTYGAILPPYYNVGIRVAAQVAQFSLWEGVYGNTFSPSRGLFVFSPYLLGVMLLALAASRRLGRRPLFWVALVWFGLHLWIISRATRWWGGHSFGPRLLTDTLPGLFLLTVLVWHEVGPRLGRAGRRLAVGGYLLLGLAAMLIHVVQGLYLLAAQQWNGPFPPDVDAAPAYVFDWRYPQFLATTGSLCARNREYLGQLMASGARPRAAYQPGEPIRFDDPGQTAVFTGWSEAEGSFRWSQCPEASIGFRLAADGGGGDGGYQLAVTSGALGEQRVRVAVNGVAVGEVTISSPPGRPIEATAVTLPLPAGLLRPGELNEIRFELPDARRPLSLSRGRDQRLLGLAFVELIVGIK